ncbi:hypothetical protein PTSG_07706 [Salpingoeca rosetta]|uniref:Lysoplasmalogenase n=1 Tax=Salpingoeca rosetta (strain ATCC 50818 / BSB-021) TaxID=946362 RepID=F2UHJ0_SALR5|nr:uncharacterized protein PTSG_07706 [Salpingoeca rosetta]EGD76589.1 hypothetical protein PTSG_07706 [Salpingoeca rosetta]|eukprot:XP_004991503.1 hypothetical protein PTSG_07706 [Salpingoeca rosetta]
MAGGAGKQSGWSPRSAAAGQMALAVVPGLLYTFFPNLLGTEQLVRVGFKCTTIAALQAIVLALKRPAQLTTRTWTLTLGALFFSMLGDAALLYEHLFTAGLASFLIAHILYAVMFSSGLRVRPAALLASGLLVVAALAILVPSMLETNKDLLVPVVLYTVAISTMQVTAACGSHHNTTAATIGAWLFTISDLTIAIGKFVTPVPYAHEIIHLLYFVGQCFLTLSVFPSKLTKPRKD